jgi:hypothetical protein
MFSLKPAYQFFCLAREHASADDLYPAFSFIGVNGIFEEHNVAAAMNAPLFLLL